MLWNVGEPIMRTIKRDALDTITWLDDTDITVCKTAFANIHGTSRQHLEKTQKNNTPSDVLIPGRRGATGSHGKILEERREKVINHIQSFPTITSHYLQKSSPNAQYLHTDVITKRQMYNLYKVWLEKNHPCEVPCSWHYYNDILKSQFPHLKLPFKTTTRPVTFIISLVMGTLS